jgi:hypothetical protein
MSRAIMRSVLVSLISVVSYIIPTVGAWANIPPIPERHSGWREGKGRLLIEIELFNDLLCDGCAMLHPEFDKFLSS